MGDNNVTLTLESGQEVFIDFDDTTMDNWLSIPKTPEMVKAIKEYNIECAKNGTSGRINFWLADYAWEICICLDDMGLFDRI